MILDEIVEMRKKRITLAKEFVSIENLKMQIKHCRPTRNFADALKQTGMQYICEVKKASPSKGDIVSVFDPVAIAKSYEAAGASAISVLTEPDFFKGDNKYLSAIAAAVAIPIIRKDFIIDAYQIYEARVIGADAILLICAILSEEQLIIFLKLAESLGLAVLVEAHDAKQIAMAVAAGASIIGVNNRDLRTFIVDLQNSIALRKQVPATLTFVAESGIKTREDIILLEQAGVDCVLIGETLMRSTDKKALLTYLKGE
ncbi:indole-3-glycerol phosphate synthase [Erysipelotrichaceae bacterium]|nr:indole-3-glycerol phosphate synthase [Erysipelotrichaceae bacterium]